MRLVFVDSPKVVPIRNGNPLDLKDKILLTAGKSKHNLIKKVHLAVAVRQLMSYRIKEEYFVYFEDNAGVIVNSKFVLEKST